MKVNITLENSKSCDDCPLISEGFQCIIGYWNGFYAESGHYKNLDGIKSDELGSYIRPQKCIDDNGE